MQPLAWQDRRMKDNPAAISKRGFPMVNQRKPPGGEGLGFGLGFGGRVLGLGVRAAASPPGGFLW